MLEPSPVRYFDFLADFAASETSADPAAVLPSVPPQTPGSMLSSPSLDTREGDDGDSESVHSRMSWLSKSTSTSLASRHTAMPGGVLSPTMRPRLVALRSGHSHSLAQDSRGNVWSWGCNAHGQVVQGVRSNITRPRQLDMKAVIPEGDRCVCGRGFPAPDHALELLFLWARVPAG